MSSHPLSKYAKILKNYASATTANLSEFNHQADVTIGGIIDTMKEILTKKGDKMAFLSLQDLNGSCETVVFPTVYKAAGALIQKDALVFVKGKVDARDDVAKLLADEIIPLEEVPKRYTRMIAINIKTAGLGAETLQDLRKILQTHKGGTPVYLTLQDPQGKMTILDSGDNLKVAVSDILFEDLDRLLGENSVKIRS